MNCPEGEDEVCWTDECCCEEEPFDPPVLYDEDECKNKTNCHWGECPEEETSEASGDEGTCGSSCGQGTSSKANAFIEASQPDGSARVELASGNVHLSVKTVAGDSFSIPVALNYNSNAEGSQGFGNRWNSGMLGKRVSPAGENAADVVTSNGAIRRYSNKQQTGEYTAPGGSPNALKQNPDGTWTETQPNGTLFHYGTQGTLDRIQPVGVGSFTLTYDPGGKLESVLSPIGKRTTFVYDSNDNIEKVVDSASRVTKFTVNAQGNLVQKVSPELCVTEFEYDGAGRLAARSNPSGDRTTYLYDGNGRLASVIGGH